LGGVGGSGWRAWVWVWVRKNVVGLKKIPPKKKKKNNNNNKVNK